MVKNQLKGRFVPDKDGKLKTVYTLTAARAGPLPPACRLPLFPAPRQIAWYGRLWLWVKKKVF